MTGPVLGHAVHLRVGVDALLRHERVVDGRQMEARVDHEDGTRRRDPVEMFGDETLPREVDGVETPGPQRRRRVVEGGVGLPQPFDHFVDGAAAGPDPAVGVAVVEVADVEVLPDAAGHRMGMGLDETGKEGRVAVAVVDLGHRVVGAQHLERPHLDDVAVVDEHRVATVGRVDRVQGPGSQDRRHRPTR